MESLADILYALSLGLLPPVAIGLIGFCAWSAFETGAWLRDCIDRWHSRRQWNDLSARLAGADSRVAARDFFERTQVRGMLGGFAEAGRGHESDPAFLSHVLSSLEIKAAQRVSNFYLGVRLAPMLGLMGTLIPLGPALLGLANGDLESLGRNLVVAFTTTVAGLFAGGVCYVLAQRRRHWLAEDVAAIERLLDCLFVEQEGRRDVANADPALA